MDCIHSVCTVSEYIHSIGSVYSFFESVKRTRRMYISSVHGLFTHRMHTPGECCGEDKINGKNPYIRSFRSQVHC